MIPYKKIGVFDSGLGGLTVLRKLIEHYPAHYIYLADTANLPYGSKTPEQIKQFSHQIASFLAAAGAELCIIACHTSSSIAFDTLCSSFPALPFLGVVNTVTQSAQRATKNKIVGVLATPATIARHAHKNALLSIDDTLNVIEVACPQLVPALEQPTKNNAYLDFLLQEYLTPIKQSGADTLILGCTHYALIRSEIEQTLGPDVTIISAEDTIVSEFEYREKNAQSIIEFFVTGDKESFIQKSKAIIDCKIIDAQKVDLSSKNEPISVQVTI